jgi:hypothetical protein
MRNITLLLLLTSGLLAGYLIGDYRGKDVRAAQEKAIATGKMLEQEHQAVISRLKTELDIINKKHDRELEKLRKNNAGKTAEWLRTKQGLDDKIKIFIRPARRIRIQIELHHHPEQSCFRGRESETGA